MPAPLRPREYRLLFDYSESVVGFRVVAEPIKSWTQVTYPRPEYIEVKDRRQPFTRRAYAAVYRIGLDRAICVGTDDVIGGDENLYLDPTGSSEGVSLGPSLRRIATVIGPIANLKLELLRNDNLRLTWSDASGTRLIELNRNREIDR